MEIVDMAMQADNSAIETGVDNSNAEGSVTPHVSCGEASCSNAVSSGLTSPTGASISSPTTVISYTPDGSQLWMTRIDEKFTPAIGKTFVDLDSAMSFYTMYARACGFEARRCSTKRFKDGIIKTKAMVCHRQGTNKRKKCPATQSGSSTKTVAKKRRVQVDEAESSNNTRITKIRRWDCKAMIKFKFEETLVDNIKFTRYRVDRFIEGHNHPLELVEKDKEYETLVDNINEFHMQMIVNNSKANVGASLTHELCKQQVGGFENVGASLRQFKNFQRDLKCLVNSKDGAMFISRLETLAETKGLHFEYEKDSKGALTRIFWTDEESMRAYAVFGDAVSYDPTYGTNKYNMKFTPFTGVDNHKRSITFACALIEHEDDESFKWVFDQFLKAMGGKEPNYIITDQDPGIINAVPDKFKTAKHRFCIWHIMKKVTDKVGSAICKDTDFLTRLNSIVWSDELEPEEFEEAWAKVISDFSLQDNTWLSGKFAEREKWIPAYFRSVSMGSLLRTSQRSESANSFFKKFENKYGTLVEFLMRYESAMDQQRHMLKLLEAESDRSIPETLFRSNWETHAVRVYTHEIFTEFQDQVKYSINTCSLGGYTPPDPVTGFEVSIVNDANKRKTYEVEHNSGTVDVRCSCKLFERRGLVCNHIIWIWSGKFKGIPEKYVLQRWNKNALKGDVYDLNGNLLEKITNTNRRQTGMAGLWNEIQLTMGMLKRKEESDVRAFTKLIKDFRTKLEPNPMPLTKEQHLELLLECKVPKETTILPPKVSKNKGGGKRLVSNKNKAMMKAKKPKRLCANCKRMAHHDKRNCPNAFAKEAPENQEYTSDVEEEEEEDENEE